MEYIGLIALSCFAALGLANCLVSIVEWFFFREAKGLEKTRLTVYAAGDSVLLPYAVRRMARCCESAGGGVEVVIVDQGLTEENVRALETALEGISRVKE